MTAETHSNPVVQWARITLLGIGQCVLSGNVISGALILVGVAYSSWQAALWFFLGSLLTSLMAKWMKAMMSSSTSACTGSAAATWASSSAPSS